MFSQFLALINSVIRFFASSFFFKDNTTLKPALRFRGLKGTAVGDFTQQCLMLRDVK